MVYKDLTESITSGHPVYGIQSRGLEPEELPFDSFEDQVLTYVQGIQSTQPKGPYFLGGYSIGGFIAHEVARRLELKGIFIPQIILLDSFVDQGENKQAGLISTKDFLLSMIEEQDLTVPTDASEVVMGNVLLREAIKVGLVPPQTPVSWIINIARELHLECVRTHNITLLRASGKGVLIVATEGKSKAQIKQQADSWESIFSSLTVYEVKCRHSHLLDKVNVGFIAQKINKHLIY